MKARVIRVVLLIGVLMWVTGCSDGNKAEENQSKGDEAASMNKIEGNWEGSIKVPKQPLPITISLKRKMNWLERLVYRFRRSRIIRFRW